MRNVPALTRRELGAYFLSPMAWIILAVWMAFAGAIFWLALRFQPVAEMEVWFGYMAFLSLLIVPVFTMRLVAEEAARGSLEMLMTSPVTEAEVILGKYAGALLFYLSLLVPTAVFPSMIAWLGDPDPGPILVGYFGLALLGGFLTAAGLFFSSIARRQVVAAFMGLVVFLLLFVLGFAGPYLGGAAGRALEHLGLIGRMQGFVVGLVDLRDVGYLVIGAGLFLFLSVKALELRRC